MTTTAKQREKSKGQIDYERDCEKNPTYGDGKKRKTWDELPDYAKQNWERYA